MLQHLAQRAILVLALAAYSPTWAADVVGRVVGVIDGDTIDVLTLKLGTVRIRLSGIDAPEAGQAFGRNAKAALSRLAYTRTANIERHKRDRFGRLVGKVVIGERDIALEMLLQGMAWHYKRFESEQEPIDRVRYAEAESMARSARAGLWNDAAPEPPWVFRSERQGRRGSPK
jgi:endonuclease YncB( thermonuclease family)